MTIERKALMNEMGQRIWQAIEGGCRSNEDCEANEECDKKTGQCHAK
jgi:hypothetical protein